MSEVHEIKGYVKASVYNALGRASPLFRTYKTFANGGELKIMKGVDSRRPDYKPILTIARKFAEQGDRVEILAPVHAKSAIYDKVYGSLRGTKFENKCPDLRRNGKFWEFESYERPFSKDKIKRMLSHGLKQSDRVIIDNTNGASDRYIRKMVMARVHLSGQRVTEVWLYEKGKTRLFFRNGNIAK